MGLAVKELTYRLAGQRKPDPRRKPLENDESPCQARATRCLRAAWRRLTAGGGIEVQVHIPNKLLIQKQRKELA